MLHDSKTRTSLSRSCFGISEAERFELREGWHRPKTRQRFQVPARGIEDSERDTIFAENRGIPYVPLAQTLSELSQVLFRLSRWENLGYA